LRASAPAYSSLSHLARYPVNRLKMSQQIVAGLASEPHHAWSYAPRSGWAWSSASRSSPKASRRRRRRAWFAPAAAEQAQGFHFGVPMPLADTSALLRDAATRPPLHRASAV